MSSFNNISRDFYNKLNEYGTNPFVLVVLILIIIVYYILFSFLGKFGNDSDEDDDEKGGSAIIEAILWGLFIVLIFVNGLSYFFNINVITELKNLFSQEPEINITNVVDTTDISMGVSEVYHIPGNQFTYNDANAICNAFDSDLATLDQLKNAQKQGASWCSYGWSKDHLALYPTSQNSWNFLQSKEGREYDCGIPGINGGYLPNNNIKLGANCYGVKPKESELDSEYLKSHYPKTPKEQIFDERVNYWKNRLGNVLISPFNNDKWFKLS